MVKISNELMWNYITGNDIEGYDIDELENNSEFMLAVIKHTSDKRLYDFCSDDVKKDYSFVVELIEHFKKDTNFICNVADYFLDNCEVNNCKLDLYLIMLKYVYNEKRVNYSMPLEFKKSFCRLMVEIDADEIMKANQSDYNKSEIEFMIIIDEYGGFDEAMKYWVESFSDEIISSIENFSLEKLAHICFLEYDDLKKYGLNNFIVNFLSLHNKVLADYIRVHEDSLEFLNGKMKLIENNWSNYSAIDQKYKCMLVDKYVDKYSEDNDLFDCYDIVKFICKELKYDFLFKHYFGENETFDSECFFDKHVASIEQLIHYNNLKKLIVEVMNAKDIDELEQKYDNYNFSALNNGSISSFKIR